MDYFTKNLHYFICGINERVVVLKILNLRNTDLLNYKSVKSDKAPLIVNYLSMSDSEKGQFSYDTYNCQGRDDYFIIYVTDGIFNTEIDGVTYHLKKGAVVLYPPKYKYHYWGEPPAKYSCAHFTGSYAENLLMDLGFPLEPYVLKGEFSPKINDLFDKMMEQNLINAMFLQHSLACLLEEILLTIAVNREKSGGYRTFKKSIKYIRANYTKKIQVPYLAKLEGISNSRYDTLFSKEMGKTPMEYILSLRLSKACELLLSTDMAISLVGETVGYKDQYFFSRIFKKHIGTSPQIYRKNNKF